MDTVYNLSDLQGLQKRGRCIVVCYHNRVYDVTEFLEDHPGGDDLIKQYELQDITHYMDDPEVHQHSWSAFDVMENYFIGLLNVPEPAEGSAEEKLTTRTEFDLDLKHNKFLDLNKPLFMQVLRANWTRDFYVSQVHKPRHYGNGSAPIFGNFLEMFTKTPWWVIPLIHVPINLLFVRSALGGLPLPAVSSLYTLGLGIWTLVEYIIHRWLFHIDDKLYENQYAYLLHFLMHGIHHYLPMDRLRLVMPPALMVLLTTPLYYLCHFVFRNFFVSQAVFAGAYMGYIVYDLTHYFLHHKQLPSYYKKLKNHHLEHHYKNYSVGFGVSTKFWDHVFGTDFIIT